MISKDNKQKVAIWYARISTNEALQKYSLWAQKKDIEEYCKIHFFKLKKIEFEKVSWTKYNKRPKLKRILEEEKFDLIISTKIDRFARNVLDLNKILLSLKEKGKEVVFIENNIDTSSLNWKLFFNILWSFAEFEAWMISERVIRWLREAKEKGKVLWRPKSKNTLEIEEINKIRNLRHKKISFSKISKELWYANWSVIFNKMKNFKKKDLYKKLMQLKNTKIKNTFAKRKELGLSIGRPKNILINNYGS